VVTVFVLKVPEFAALADVAKRDPACRVSDTGKGYLRIDSDGDLVFDRKELGFKPAVWYSAFSGGFKGRIAEFGRDIVRLTSA
jgi:hypothetical protein